MGNRVNRAHGIAALVERKEHRKYVQRFACALNQRSLLQPLSLVEWREANAVAVAQLAQEQAAMNRNRQQSAQAQSEQE